MPDYDGSKVACVVGNHTSFLDTPMNCLRQLAGFIAKSSVRKIPGIGPIAVAS